MIAVLAASCWSISVSTTWKAFRFPENTDYDNMFRVKASSVASSDDFVDISADGGWWGSSIPANILDDNKATYWESNKQLSSSLPNVNLKMIFKGHEMEDITRIILLGRQSASKGFPIDFDILISENETSETTLIYKAKFSGFNSYGSWVQLDIPKSTFGFMQFVIRSVAGGEGRPNIAEIRFYTEDRVDILSDNLFSDGTWSKLGISKDEAKEFLAKIENHPANNTLKNHVRVLKDVIMNGKDIEKTIFELNSYINFRGGSQHSSSLYTGEPLGYYAHSSEEIEVFCDYQTVNKPWIQSIKFLDKNGDFKADTQSLNKGYNKYVTQKIITDDLALTSSFVSLLYGGYSRSDGDVGKPKCRIVGGMRFPLYKDEHDDPCEFEKSLLSYSKHIDCNRSNFKTINRHSKYDVGIVMSRNAVSITTATALVKAMEANRAVGRNFHDVMYAWQKLPEQYALYDGFYANDTKNYNRPSDGIHLSILIAQDGKPYAWADGFFTGYNNGKNRREGTCTSTGDFAANLASYTSITQGGWGYFHEWGHIYDNGLVKLTETTNNLYSLMMERYFNVRPNRVERDGYIRDLYNYGNQPSNLGIWHHLLINRQFEMFYGQDRFHAEFMRWLRDGHFTEHTKHYDQLEHNSRWPFAASLFSGYDVFDLYTPHGYTWEKAHNYTDKFLKPLNLKKFPNTLIYANDRFQYNLEVKDQKGCNLNDNNKMYIKQMKVVDNVATVTLGITGIDNEFVEILGYEMKNDTGLVERFSQINGITTTFGNSIDYVVTPVTLKLRRLPPAHITSGGEFEFVNQTGWVVDTWPSGMIPHEGTAIPNMIDDNENTCFFSQGINQGINYPHGFQLDLGKVTEFYGFKYHIDGHGWGHGKNITVEYSLDNVTWSSFPKQKNATFVLHEGITSSMPRYQVYTTPFTARYIRGIQYGEDTKGNTHFRLCDFKLIKNPKLTITEVTNDKDYLARSDICNEVRDQSMFLDKSRYGFVPLKSSSCPKPGNVTEDEWAEDFMTPNPDFTWPDEEPHHSHTEQKQEQDQDDGQVDPNSNPKKSNSLAIGVGVAVAIIAVIIVITVIVIIAKKRNFKDSEEEVRDDLRI